MSIWSSAVTFDGDDAPWVYPGSHVMPSRNYGRAGDLDVAFIPGHIRAGADLDVPDLPTPHGWLRVASGEVTVLLDRDQAGQLHEFLGRWLGAAPTAGMWAVRWYHRLPGDKEAGVEQVRGLIEHPSEAAAREALVEGSSPVWRGDLMCNSPWRTVETGRYVEELG